MTFFDEDEIREGTVLEADVDGVVITYEIKTDDGVYEKIDEGNVQVR